MKELGQLLSYYRSTVGYEIMERIIVSTMQLYNNPQYNTGWFEMRVKSLWMLLCKSFNEPLDANLLLDCHMSALAKAKAAQKPKDRNLAPKITKLIYEFLREYLTAKAGKPEDLAAQDSSPKEGDEVGEEGKVVKKLPYVL